MADRSESDLTVHSPAIGIAGRVMFTLIFFLSGITHFTAMGDYVALMPPAIPFRAFWVVISGVVELAGAAMIVADRRPRLGAWLIVVFLVPVTIVVHGTAMVADPDARMRAIQLSFFLKGVAMTGAALLITQLGVAPCVPAASAR
ncbi:MAG: DoxX family membrane protein [Thermodesulfobacteriota bacterium]